MTETRVFRSAARPFVPSERSTPGPEPVWHGYLGALLARDAHLGRRALLYVMSQGLRARDVELGVIWPAMVEVGRLWQANRLTVADEHLATAISQAQLAWLAPLLDGARGHGPRLVLAGTAGELHVLGLQMLGDFLTADGWDVSNLGQSVPAPDLAALVAEIRPRVVGLSTALTLRLPEARAAVAAIKALPDPPLVIVGGAAYDGHADLGRSLGADHFASDAGEAGRLLAPYLDPTG